MKYIKSDISKQAQKLGYITDTYEKVLRLVDILKFVNQNNFLCEMLVLKGGTAINLLSNLPRLSVDIDFDYNSFETLDKLTKNRTTINNLISKYMKSMEYKLSTKSKYTKILDSFVFSYVNSSGNNDNIKIEINYALRLHILKIQNQKINFSSNIFNVKMLSIVELYATKITALLNRGTVRDLFDVSNMIENKFILDKDKNMLRKSIIFYLILNNNKDELFDYSKIETINQRRAKAELYPMLRKKDFFDIERIKQTVINYLQELFILESTEKRFIDEFYNGKLYMNLLFDNNEIAKTLTKHPMIIWKIEHIINYKKLNEINGEKR